MSSEREYFFKASSLGGMIVTIDDMGVSVRTDRATETAGYRRRIAFADVKQITVTERHGRRSLTESVDLQPHSGQSAFFGVTVPADGRNEVALQSYRQAAAAVLQAYARKHPEARVRYGRTATNTAISLITLGVLASVVTALYLWQTWPPTSVSYLVLLAIAVYFYSVARRLGIGKKSLFMPARAAADRAEQIAAKLPVS